MRLDFCQDSWQPRWNPSWEPPPSSGCSDLVKEFTDGSTTSPCAVCEHHAREVSTGVSRREGEIKRLIDVRNLAPRQQTDWLPQVGKLAKTHQLFLFSSAEVQVTINKRLNHHLSSTSSRVQQSGWQLDEQAKGKGKEVDGELSAR